MLSHRFKLGQTVTIVPGSAGRGMPPGQYVVVRLLPVAGGEPHYRAKSMTEGTEWAVVEAQMQPVAVPGWPGTKSAAPIGG